MCKFERHVYICIRSYGQNQENTRHDAVLLVWGLLRLTPTTRKTGRDGTSACVIVNFDTGCQTWSFVLHERRKRPPILQKYYPRLLRCQLKLSGLQVTSGKIDIAGASKLQG